MIREVAAGQDGYITAIDGEALGLSVVSMGGGRMVETDQIDPAVGLSGIAQLGAKVDARSGLAVIHASREETAARMEEAVRRAFTIGAAPPDLPLLVHERLTD